jgi:hypothetical protein
MARDTISVIGHLSLHIFSGPLTPLELHKDSCEVVFSRCSAPLNNACKPQFADLQSRIDNIIKSYVFTLWCLLTRQNTARTRNKILYYSGFGFKNDLLLTSKPITFEHAFNRKSKLARFAIPHIQGPKTKRISWILKNDSCKNIMLGFRNAIAKKPKLLTSSQSYRQKAKAECL